MKKQSTRMLAMLVAMLMVLSMVPFSAFAAIVGPDMTLTGKIQVNGADYTGPELDKYGTGYHIVTSTWNGTKYDPAVATGAFFTNGVMEPVTIPGKISSNLRIRTSNPLFVWSIEPQPAAGATAAEFLVTFAGVEGQRLINGVATPGPVNVMKDGVLVETIQSAADGTFKWFTTTDGNYSFEYPGFKAVPVTVTNDVADPATIELVNAPLSTTVNVYENGVAQDSHQVLVNVNDAHNTTFTYTFPGDGTFAFTSKDRTFDVMRERVAIVADNQLKFANNEDGVDFHWAEQVITMKKNVNGQIVPYTTGNVVVSDGTKSVTLPVSADGTAKFWAFEQGTYTVTVDGKEVAKVVVPMDVKALAPINVVDATGNGNWQIVPATRFIEVITKVNGLNAGGIPVVITDNKGHKDTLYTDEFGHFEFFGFDGDTAIDANTGVSYLQPKTTYTFTGYSVLKSGVKEVFKISVTDADLVADVNPVILELKNEPAQLVTADGFDLYRVYTGGDAAPGWVTFYAVMTDEKGEILLDATTATKNAIINEAMPIGSFPVDADGHIVLTDAQINDMNAKLLYAPGQPRTVAVRATGGDVYNKGNYIFQNTKLANTNEKGIVSFANLSDDKAVAKIDSDHALGFQVRNFEIRTIADENAPSIYTENGKRLTIKELSEATSVKALDAFHSMYYEDDLGRIFTKHPLKDVKVEMFKNVTKAIGAAVVFEEKAVETQVSGENGIAYFKRDSIVNSERFLEWVELNGKYSGTTFPTKAMLGSKVVASKDGFFVYDTEHDGQQDSETYFITMKDINDDFMEYYWMKGVKNPDIVDRIAGNTRYATAVEVATALENALNFRGKGFNNKIILTTGTNFPDALVANGLTAEWAYNAPLLLTTKDKLSKEVADYLADHPGVAEVVLVGGTQAISANVESQLEQLGYQTTRMAGANRFETAVKVKDTLIKYWEKWHGKAYPYENVFLANGYTYADALIASVPAVTYGLPILLTAKDELPQVTYDAMKAFYKTTVVGGEAVVGANVYTAINTTTKERLYGWNRQLTSMVIAEKFFPNATKVYVATGEKYADALVAGRLAAEHNAAIILVGKDNVDPKVIEYIKNSKITSVTVIGGTDSVSEKVRAELEAAVLSK
ncbi:cell wall-binding repeat-containing protein [Guggenheimella bovis]